MFYIAIVLFVVQKYFFSSLSVKRNQKFVQQNKKKAKTKQRKVFIYIQRMYMNLNLLNRKEVQAKINEENEIVKYLLNT